MKQFMLASGLALSLGLVAHGANYYVDGTAKGGDGSAKAPYPTIQQAADVAQAGDTVFIKPGIYCETVKVKNSGKDGSPITFRNCPGEEKPTICGGDRVTWPWTKEGDNIYSARCNWGMKVPGQNQVVVDGDMMIEAREPNISGKEQLVEVRTAKRLFESVKGDKTACVISNAPNWTPGFWKGAVVWNIGSWGAMSAMVTNSFPAEGGQKLLLGKVTERFHYAVTPCFISGARGALDHEKEFFLDGAAGRLYLMPPGKADSIYDAAWRPADPSGLTVYAKKRSTVIEMYGVTNVVFDRVNTMMGGIYMSNVTHCALLNSSHRYSSHFTMIMDSAGEFAQGGSPHDPENSGIYISGEGCRIEGCEIAYSATGVRLLGIDHIIRNNVITDIYGGTYFGNVYINHQTLVRGQRGGHLVERNTLARASRDQIVMTTGSISPPDVYKKCRILHNELADCMMNTEDGGAMYWFALDGGGTEVAYNWIHGEHGDYNFNPALYADNNCLNYRYHHNVIWDIDLGIGWNCCAGGLEAYNNTIWSRGGSVKVTRESSGPVGSKVCNTLSNRDYKEAAAGKDTQTNNMTAGGFVGNPDKPVSGLDFRLATNSPAINAGLVIPGVTDGSVGVPDVGAYEFGGVAWTAGAGTEPIAPAAPTDFSATAETGHGIRLGWSDNAFNETGYTIERSSDGKNWTPVAALPADAFVYVDAGLHLKAGTAYQYRVAATNAFGRSSSASASVTTPAAVKAPVITSPLAASGWASGAFTYPICASNDPAELTATGLPKGLSLNPITGVISGVPAAPGVANIQITATNAKGSDTRTLVLTLLPPGPVSPVGGSVTNYTDAGGTNWTAHIFRMVGTNSFSIKSGGVVEYLVVGGGGGGGGGASTGGGGGGNVAMGKLLLTSPGTYSVVVGAGGAAASGSAPAQAGGVSAFGNISASGGGAGTGNGGGSAGSVNSVTTEHVGGIRFTGQGNMESKRAGGGGGGSGQDGQPGATHTGGNGGNGLESSIAGVTTCYGGGGGGGAEYHQQKGVVAGSGGKGGGGRGEGNLPAYKDTFGWIPATPGEDGLGGGGGGAGGTWGVAESYAGGKGGSGIVVVRYVTGK